MAMLHSETSLGRMPEPAPADISLIQTGPLTQQTIPMDWGANVAIPAARARHGMSPREWVQRAVELAYRQQIDGTLRFHGIHYGKIHYGAPKRYNPQHEDNVVVDMAARIITCTCALYASGLPCGHIGALVNILRGVQENTAEHATARANQVDILQAALHG